MIRKILFIFLFTVLFFPQFSFSQQGGNNTFEFLNLPLSARISSGGGNLIGIKDDDINLGILNPSVLSEGMHNNLSLSYMNYFAGINYGHSAYARHYKNIGTFGASIFYINYGKFNEADETGQITGTFTASDHVATLSYGRQIDSNLSIGANLKTIYSTYYGYSSIGSALDLAGTYNNPRLFLTFSAIIKNIGYQWKPYVSDNREPLPFEVQLGLSKRLKKAPIRFFIVYENLEKWDLTYEDLNNPEPTVDPLTGEPIKQSKFKKWGDKMMRHVIPGAELLLGKNFYIDFAYNYQRRKEMQIEGRRGMSGFSFGLGMKISKFRISYGRAVYHVAGGSNQFTITSNLSDFISKSNVAGKNP